MRFDPSFFQEAGHALDNFNNVPLLLFVLPKADKVDVEASLSKRFFECVEFVLVLVERKLLHLAGGVEGLDNPLNVGFLTTFSGEEVNTDKRLLPVLELPVIVDVRDDLFNYFEGVTAVGDAKF